MTQELTPEEAWSRLLDSMPPWARRLASMAGDGDAWEDFTRQVAGERQPFWRGMDPQEFFKTVIEGGQWGQGRVKASRGDVRSAILALLVEEPMHGYQLMQEMSTRSSGAWRPSPGSVYPTLSAMEEEGLIEAEHDSGRKVFSLTTDGRVAAAAEDGAQPPWESVSERAQEASAQDQGGADGDPADEADAPPRVSRRGRGGRRGPDGPHAGTPHAEAMHELRNAVGSLLRTGDDEQKAQALEVLTEARRSIYRLLADG